MTRLTKKKDDHYVYINGTFHNIGEHVEKLGQLEDFEEQLGINLKIILKVLMTMKVWAIKDGRIRRFYVTDIVSYKKILKGYITFGDTHNGWCTEEEIKFEDYGITWALTKEELTKKELL